MKKLLLAMLLLAATGVYAQHARFDYGDSIAIGYAPQFIDATDVNGDNLTDIVAVTGAFFFGTDHKIIVLLQGANGQLQPPYLFDYNYTTQLRCFATGDIDGDGAAEIMLGMGEVLSIYKWANNGLQLHESIATVGYSCWQDAIATADLDLDGLMDIAVSHSHGDSLVVLFQNTGTGPHWDRRKYHLPNMNDGLLKAGKFATLPHTTLAYMRNNATPGNPLIDLLTFDAARNIKQQYGLRFQTAGYNVGYSMAFVDRGPAKPGELWVTCRHGVPAMGRWRGLQTFEDTFYTNFNYPEIIQSDNLDCDDDDEPVILCGAQGVIEFHTDKMDTFRNTLANNHPHESLALGDINNDGKKDICIAPYHRPYVYVRYNTTPTCLPADVPLVTAGSPLSVHPNPAGHSVSLSHPATGSLYITNTQGRELYRRAFNKRATINMSNWPAGVYFFSLRGNDGAVVRTKVMKE